MSGARRISVALAALLACGLIAPAQAALESCAVQAAPLSFGAYDPLSASPRDSTSTIRVECTVSLLALLVGWEIQLSTGNSGSYSPRRLTAGASDLAYNIYTNATHAIAWGNGSGGSAPVTDSRLLVIGTSSFTYTAYGRIPPAQDVRPGSYTDTIVVTLLY